jgi:hypothetical protein
LEEVGEILSSGLPDVSAEITLRAVLHLAEETLVRHGTTSGMLAKRLIEERRKL